MNDEEKASPIPMDAALEPLWIPDFTPGQAKDFKISVQDSVQFSSSTRNPFGFRDFMDDPVCFSCASLLLRLPQTSRSLAPVFSLSVPSSLRPSEVGWFLRRARAICFCLGLQTFLGGGNEGTRGATWGHRGNVELGRPGGPPGDH